MNVWLHGKKWSLLNKASLAHWHGGMLDFEGEGCQHTSSRRPKSRDQAKKGNEEEVHERSRD
jgi:hypothetical protein